MESGIFWICSPKWVFLILPLAKSRAWPGDCHRAFLHSNSLNHELGIFFCIIWWWGFSGERQQSLHLRVCELKTLPVGDSLDWQPRFPGCRSVQTHAAVNRVLISMKISPQIIRLYMALVWLLHQKVMVSSSLVTTVYLKIFKVFIALPQFISSFHHLCCEVGASKYNLGFTD